MKTENCKNCDKTFEGRINKKFCSQKCKNEYHNTIYRDQNKILAQIDKIMHRNRSVLKDMYNVHRSSPIKIAVLKARGFKPDFHTHIFSSSVGGRYTMIYDIGYKNLFDEKIQIVEGDRLS